MTSTTLTRGQNTDLPAVAPLRIELSGTGVDVLAFQLGADRRVRSDADLVFFNQPRSPEGAVVLAGPSTVTVDLAALPDDIERVAVAVAAESDLGAVALTTTVTAGTSVIVAPAEGLSTERAAVLVEIYRRNGVWKIRSESAGWDAGFAALVREHGVVVDEEPQAAPAANSVGAPTIRMVKGEEKLSLEKRKVLNLRKEAVHKVLLTKGVAGVRARVILVIDKTLSMRPLFDQGTVRRVVERMIPVATQLDDDGSLETYLYGSGYAKLPDVTVENAEEWTDTFIHLTGVHGGRLSPPIDYGRVIGGYNKELPIMTAVVDDVAGTSPVLVLFFTDGGFHSKVPAIRKLITDAASRPIFWQFIGLGRNNFGVLTQLDTMTGRVIDNAGFFPIDDVDAHSDEELYKDVLSEFGSWLTEAGRLGIVR
ncbi:stress protein [Gordonia sp. TBRC 11910]|uniref:Stress protein n=1 Tax=Gordonia asplenii TaxID=2725283 RepID=A0A848KQA1_9ACTN|nr:VWA domain-containing protein [Gordonia asplenii]NMO00412.1 stress protein [Gordonia asplenii]